MNRTKIALSKWRAPFIEITTNTTPQEIMLWLNELPASQFQQLRERIWHLIGNFGKDMCPMTDDEPGTSFFIVAEKKNPKYDDKKVQLVGYSAEEFAIEYMEEDSVKIYADGDVHFEAKANYPFPPDDGECEDEPEDSEGNKPDDDEPMTDPSQPEPEPESSPIPNDKPISSAMMAQSSVSVKPSFVPNLNMGVVESTGRYVNTPTINVDPSGMPNGMDDISKNILKNMSKQLGSMRRP